MGITHGITKLSVDDAVNEFKQWFESSVVPWLLVFDNADDQQCFGELLKIFPQSKKGKIIVTSRNSTSCDKFGFGYKVGPLEKEEAVDLLF